MIPRCKQDNNISYTVKGIDVSGPTCEGFGRINKLYGNSTESGSGEKNITNPYTVTAVAATDINLFNIDDIEYGQISQTDGSNQSADSYELYRTKNFINIKGNTQYTLNLITTVVRVFEYNESKTLIKHYAVSTGGTFTTDSNARYLRIQRARAFNKKTKLQEGSVATVFSAYGEGTIKITSKNGEQTAEKIISCKPLCKITKDGNVIAQDYIDFAKGLIVRQCEYLRLTGEETWRKAGLTSSDLFVLDKKELGLTNKPVYCNYFNNSDDYTQAIGMMQVLNGSGNDGSAEGCRIAINFSTYNTTTLAQFKTWLASHNTIMIIPIEEIYKTISVSNNIIQFANNTQVYNEESATMEIELTTDESISSINESIGSLQEKNKNTSERASIMATLGANYTTTTTQVEKLVLVESNNSDRDKFTVSAGGIKIGKGVSKIKVSALVSFYGGIQSGDLVTLYINKNSATMTVAQQKAVAAISLNLPDYQFDVQEGDIIYLYARTNSRTGGQINTHSYMTITDMSLEEGLNAQSVIIKNNYINKDEEISISLDEPEGNDRKKVWFQKSKNYINENLISMTAVNGITPNIVDGKITFEGTNSGNGAFTIPIYLEKGTYIFSWYGNHLNPHFTFRDKKNNFIQTFIGGTSSESTITITQDDDYIIGLNLNDGLIYTSENTFFNIMLEKGTEASTYEPYFNPRIQVLNDKGVYDTFIKEIHKTGSFEITNTDFTLESCNIAQYGKIVTVNLKLAYTGDNVNTLNTVGYITGVERIGNTRTIPCAAGNTAWQIQAPAYMIIDRCR